MTLRIVGPDEDPLEEENQYKILHFTIEELDWLMAAVSVLRRDILPVIERYPGARRGLQEILSGNREHPLPTEEQLDELQDKLNTPV